MAIRETSYYVYKAIDKFSTVHVHKKLGSVAILVKRASYPRRRLTDIILFRVESNRHKIISGK